MNRLAVLEGARLEDSGDMPAAWGWYRASLRSSRHVGSHGFIIERIVGVAIHHHVSDAILRWATDPRVDAPLLRQALAEMIAVDTMTAPTSDAVKLDYLMFVLTVDKPEVIEDLLLDSNGISGDWARELSVPKEVKKPIQTTRVILNADRERSQRITRLMVANWLAQVDKPPSQRAKLARRQPWIYEAGPTDPPAARALSPDALAKWVKSSLLARSHVDFFPPYLSSIERERVRQARLVVHLADQFYRREHGSPPPSPAALVGPYLKALPEGYDQDPEKIVPLDQKAP